MFNVIIKDLTFNVRNIINLSCEVENISTTITKSAVHNMCYLIVIVCIIIIRHRKHRKLYS